MNGEGPKLSGLVGVSPGERGARCGQEGRANRGRRSNRADASTAEIKSGRARWPASLA
jgi:hypothetical protein